MISEVARADLCSSKTKSRMGSGSRTAFAMGALSVTIVSCMGFLSVC